MYIFPLLVCGIISLDLSVHTEVELLHLCGEVKMCNDVSDYWCYCYLIFFGKTIAMFFFAPDSFIQCIYRTIFFVCVRFIWAYVCCQVITIFPTKSKKKIITTVIPL